MLENAAILTLLISYHVLDKGGRSTVWRQDSDHLILGCSLVSCCRTKMNPSHLCLGPILLQSAAAAARIYALKWLRIRDQIVDAVLALVGDEVNTHAPKEL